MFTVNYVKPGRDLVYDQRHLGPGSEQLSDRIEQRLIDIEDGRAANTRFSLSASGFELVEVDFNYDRFDSSSGIKDDLLPAVSSWLKSRLGASEVLVFDHTFRSKAASEKTTQHRSPVKTAHNDYTSNSAEHRLYQETISRPELRQKRFQFINLWMPIYHKVEESPLAMVDISTAKESDYHPLRLLYPDREGEIAAISYNPDHKWYYFSEMAPGEALLIKVFDSEMGTKLNGVPHTAVDPIEAAHPSALRSSLEIRTIAFFEDH
ncbi:CmcJ/NvfI family oxidoreductase [Litoribacillus peritrichatus]|uniref:CmcJ/NvfI family oxidoreductase n=1 Tax=Litoribacillus peritrichatus TaxID=718191 RepID=A0ABP7MDJ6_9GAMM